MLDPWSEYTFNYDHLDSTQKTDIPFVTQAQQLYYPWTFSKWKGFKATWSWAKTFKKHSATNMTAEHMKSVRPAMVSLTDR